MTKKYLLTTAKVLAVAGLLCLDTGVISPVAAQTTEGSSDSIESDSVQSDALENSSRLSKELAQIPQDSASGVANESADAASDSASGPVSPELEAAVNDSLQQMREQDLEGGSNE